MKFTLPDTLPTEATELNKLATQARAEINVFQARAAAGDDQFTAEEAERLEYLNASYATIDGAITELAAADESAAADQAAHNERVAAALEKSKAATTPAPKPEAPKADPAPAPESKPDDGGAAAAEVVAEAEAATQEAAAPVVVAAAAKPVNFAVASSDIPATPATEAGKRWALVASAPNFAQHSGELVDTSVIAAGIATNGQFTGIPDGVPTVLATMQRPQGQVYENYDEFLAELDRVGSEIPGYGAVSAKSLVAAGGWCAPSEQLYDFCETPAAVGLLSFPEMAIKRGGVIFPAEPDFSSLQTGFHFTEPQLQATDGNGLPTAIKNLVEIPCPDDMIEYRLEAIGWGVKSGILQRRAWPELTKKFLDEFLVAHQYRVSAKSLLKVLAQSSAAKVIPTDAVLGATTSILNGLHVRATNLQLKTRKPVIEGIAPMWFRDVLRADLASRDGLDVLNVTNADVDRWLADRGIYLQYDGQWQSLTAGQPGHEDTSWWPGSVDVVLYPAGTFWRSLQNVVTIGAQFDLNLLTQNRELVGFVEDEFQVGKRCYPSHLIRIPLCVNGAVGARESIDCSGPYAAKRTATVVTTGTPAGGNFTLKFSGNDTPSSTIAYNASAANADTALTGIDDGVAATGDITTTGGPLPTAIVVTYPAELGDLELGTNSLTGGTNPSVSIS